MVLLPSGSSPLILPLNSKINTCDALTSVSLPCITMHVSLPPCAVPVIDENTRLLFISSGQCSAHGLRQAWRKEREEKKSFFPSHWGQTQEQVVLGGSLPSMRDSYCCSEGRGAFEHALVWWGGWGKSGREIWISAKLRHSNRGCDKETLW